MNATATRGRFNLKLNVDYVLHDRFGNEKKMFAENKIGKAILRFFRQLAPSPIGADGQVKTGILNYFAAYGIRIPFITGSWSSHIRRTNIVTNAGKAGVASRINGSGAEAAFTYIATGTGAVAAALGDTTLGTELAVSGLSRANSTASRITTDVTNDTSRLQNTFTVTGTAAVTESGVLNAAAAGVLLARQTFSAINVVNGDSLQITWDVDVD